MWAGVLATKGTRMLDLNSNTKPTHMNKFRISTKVQEPDGKEVYLSFTASQANSHDTVVQV